MMHLRMYLNRAAAVILLSWILLGFEVTARVGPVGESTGADKLLLVEPMVGCPDAQDTLYFASGHQLVFNDGRLGIQGSSHNLLWDNDPWDPEYGIMYDGGMFLVGDSVLARYYLYGTGDYWIPNPAPTSGVCGFDVYDGTLGYRREGSSPVAITGRVFTHSMSDTDMTYPPDAPEAAIGVEVRQTVVGADDMLYGDFTLIHWDLTERNGNTLTDLLVGTFVDWDVPASYGSNLGRIWPSTVNGYVIWDEFQPGNAYGYLDPTANPIYGAGILDQNDRSLTPGTPLAFYLAVRRLTPDFLNDGQGDRAAMLVSAPVSLQPYGTGGATQALFGVSAYNGSADVALMEADALDVARRAARWAGFDRGDVNDDGTVDQEDVQWLQMVLAQVPGYRIYPANYNGDVDNNNVVDANDVALLQDSVHTPGSPLPGRWRFDNTRTWLAGCPIINGFGADPVVVTAGDPAANTTSAIDNEGDPITYHLIAGPGTVNQATGDWSYATTCDDFPGFDVVVEVTDRDLGDCQIAQFHVEVQPPPLEVSCIDVEAICGIEMSQMIDAIGGCPSLTYDQLSGPGSTNDTGYWHYTGHCAFPGVYEVTVEVRDNTALVALCGFTVTVLSEPVPCACDCHADPECDSVTNVLDVVRSVNVAFRGSADIPDPNPDCPYVTTDIDCNGVTDVLDVVHLVNVAFRGGDPVVEFCDPCAP